MVCPNTYPKDTLVRPNPNEFNRQLLIQNLRQNHCMNAEVYTNVVGDRTGTCFISSYSPNIQETMANVVC